MIENTLPKPIQSLLATCRREHEYVNSPEELADALNAAHEYVPALQDTLDRIAERIGRRYPEAVP